MKVSIDNRQKLRLNDKKESSTKKFTFERQSLTLKDKIAQEKFWLRVRCDLQKLLSHRQVLPD